MGIFHHIWARKWNRLFVSLIVKTFINNPQIILLFPMHHLISTNLINLTDLSMFKRLHRLKMFRKSTAVKIDKEHQHLLVILMILLILQILIQGKLQKLWTSHNPNNMQQIHQIIFLVSKLDNLKKQLLNNK